MISCLGGLYKMLFSKSFYTKDSLIAACKSFEGSGDYKISNDISYPYYVVSFAPLKEFENQKEIPYEFVNYVLQVMREGGHDQT
jgi:hypothetical protein